MESGASQCPLRGINTLGGPSIVASRGFKNHDSGREVEGEAAIGDAGYGEGPLSAAERANAPELCGTFAAGACVPPGLSAHPAAPRWGSEDLHDSHIEEDSLWRYQQPQQRGRAGAPMVRSYSTTAPPNATFGQGSHYLCCQKIELMASRPWTKLHPEPHTPCFLWVERSQLVAGGHRHEGKGGATETKSHCRPLVQFLLPRPVSARRLSLPSHRQASLRVATLNGQLRRLVSYRGIPQASFVVHRRRVARLAREGQNFQNSPDVIPGGGVVTRDPPIIFTKRLGFAIGLRPVNQVYTAASGVCPISILRRARPPGGVSKCPTQSGIRNLRGSTRVAPLAITAADAGSRPLRTLT